MSRNQSEKKPERDDSLGHDWGPCPYQGIVFGESRRLCKSCRKVGLPSASKEPCIIRVVARLQKLEQEVEDMRAVNPLVI